MLHTEYEHCLEDWITPICWYLIITAVFPSVFLWPYLSVHWNLGPTSSFLIPKLSFQSVFLFIELRNCQGPHSGPMMCILKPLLATLPTFMNEYHQRQLLYQIFFFNQHSVATESSLPRPYSSPLDKPLNRPFHGSH